MRSFRKYLTEKLIILGGGARYGQVLFLAGGGGSGKGFAISNFLEGGKFLIRDVDKLKVTLLKIAVLKNRYPEIRGLDLRKPKDVSKMHLFVQEKGFKEKTLDLLLSQAKIGKLPNIIFDTTLKDKSKVNEIIPLLTNVGYVPRNVHLVWVLTNYGIAIQQNREKKRGRIVPEEIMLTTHEGAARTMYDFIRSGTPKGIDGSVHVILGGAKHTIFWNDPKTGKPMDGRAGRTVVKDFKYLTLKTPGSGMTRESDVLGQVSKWIVDNTPKTFGNRHIFGSGQKKQKK